MRGDSERRFEVRADLRYSAANIAAAARQPVNDDNRIEDAIQTSWWASMNFHISELDDWRDDQLTANDITELLAADTGR